MKYLLDYQEDKNIMALLPIFVFIVLFVGSGIIRELDLLRPIYKQTAAYGHFGRTDVDLPWEHTDKAATLREQAGL